MIRFKLSSVITIGLFSATMLAASTDARAYRYGTCNDHPKGQRSHKTYRFNRFSISAGGTREGDVDYGMDMWDAIVGMYNRFNFTDGSNGSTIYHGDDKWDVFFATQSNLDGALGLTKVFYDCKWANDDGHYEEVDIGFASNVSWDTGTPNSCTGDDLLLRRNVVIHEFGHALGMRHDSDEFTVMHVNGDAPSSLLGRYCANDITIPKADDVQFGKNLHGSGYQRYDPAVSSYYLFADDQIRATTASETKYVCPGDKFWARWTWENRGTKNIASVKQKVVLSTNKTISNGDLVAYTRTSWGNVGWFKTYNKQITVPNSVSYNTTYYIGVYLDYDNGVSPEWSGSNNTTYLRRKVRIKSANDC